MNQIRSADNIIELPDWTNPNEPYQILPLSKSLSENQSITVRLESSKVQRALLNPENESIMKPSMSDIYFMEQPQEFLAKEITSDEYKPRTDRIEKDIIQPVSFENPKIRVGRDKIKTNKNV
jgi:hypothetical protein